MILSAIHPKTLKKPARPLEERRSATLDLIRALYPQAPQATLCMPFCKAKPALAECSYLASTDGQHASAVIAYKRDAIEFTWCRPGHGETLRNLIAQVQHRVKALAFLPVMETQRRSWCAQLGLPRRGRFFRAIYSQENSARSQAVRGFELAPFDPDTDLQAAADLLQEGNSLFSSVMNPRRLRRLIEAEYSFPDGWFFLQEKSTGARVGLAINGYCPDFQEGFVDWIQITPRLRRRRLGSLLLQESLRRMQHARFITVTGSLESSRASLELFEQLGFHKTRSWTILGQAAPARP